MGWVWKDDDESEEFKSSSSAGEVEAYKKQSSDEVCSTRKVVRSNCKTEEVEPGKFLRKCEKTEEVLRECLGKPTEVLKSNKEYTEEDVTEMMSKGSFQAGSHDWEGGPFSFPGLRSDIGELESHFQGHFDRFFQAAEEMKNSLLDAFEGFPGENSAFPPFTRRNIPIEGRPEEKRSHYNQEEVKNGDVDISGLAKEV
ncbi:unnamed protein product [Linum trigynum]|uniref:Mal d 1-associated protein n=2 Tax=Linum trigynum TaxID=586398 RepID=A0AAV2DEF5_9ROSI